MIRKIKNLLKRTDIEVFSIKENPISILSIDFTIQLQVDQYASDEELINAVREGLNHFSNEREPVIESITRGANGEVKHGSFDFIELVEK